MRPRAYVTRRLPDAAVEILRRHCGRRCGPRSSPPAGTAHPA